MSHFGQIPVVLDKKETDISFKVEKSLSKLEGIEQYFLSVLYFGSPHNRIVACSTDEFIRIWSINSSKCRKIKAHSRRINNIIQWTESTFLSCSDDKTIKCFSISFKKKEFIFKTKRRPLKTFRVRGYAYRLLKLSDDLFVCRTECGWFKCELNILSYSKGRIMKKYSVGFLQSGRDFPLLLSKRHLNSFYVPTQDSFESIFLIDFERDLRTKEFRYRDCESLGKGLGLGSGVFAMTLFVSSKNKEILIVFDRSSLLDGSGIIVFFFNSSDPRFSKEKKVIEVEEDDDFTSDLPLLLDKDSKIVSCCCSQNQILVCGDGVGWVSLLRIWESESEKLELRIINRKLIHDVTMINEVKCFAGKSSSNLKVFSAGRDGIRISNVHPVRLIRFTEDAYDLKDRTERKTFLMNYVDENRRLSFKISLLGLQVHQLIVPKILFF